MRRLYFRFWYWQRMGLFRADKLSSMNMVYA